MVFWHIQLFLDVPNASRTFQDLLERIGQKGLCRTIDKVLLKCKTKSELSKQESGHRLRTYVCLCVCVVCVRVSNHVLDRDRDDSMCACV